MFSWVQDWFKPIAYALILLRQNGYPCVFYGDYYGIPSEKVHAKKDMLDKLLLLRKDFVYGTEHDYFDHPNLCGWTLEGDVGHPHSGIAVLISNNMAGQKQMYVGKHFAGTIFYDYLGNHMEKVRIDENGYGTFFVNSGSVSAWVQVKGS